MITLKVTDQGISSVSESLRSVVGSVNVERVKFEFDESWSDLTRFACFRNKVEFHVLLDDSNECNIPWEVLTNEGTLCVGALGMDGDTVVKPTLWVKYSDVFIGTDPEGAGTTEHTKSALEQMIQIQEETKQIAEDLQEAAESGEFDGKPGYTPIRGKDYWTSEDQQFIVDEATKQVGPLVDEAKTAAEDATAAKESIENMGVSAESVPYDEPAEVEKTVEEDVVNLHFKIPRGKTGNSGVHYGSDKPTDPNTNVWINPEGETDESYYNKTVAAAKRAESSAQSAQQASDDAKAYSESAALSKTSAEEAAQSASTSAQSASTDATTASQAASTATSAKESAAQSAQQASGAASSASTSAGAASSSAQEAGEAATKAEGHASDAQSSANLASGAATTATQANTEAQSAAQSASTSASQATTAASTAQDHATAASTAKDAAEQAATEAENAQSGAAQSSQAASNSAREADDAKRAAQKAAAILPAPTQEDAGKFPMVNPEGNGYIFGEAGGGKINDSVLGKDTTWSSLNIVDSLAPKFESSGPVVTCNPVPGYPLSVVSQIVAVQSGSGDPSPENVRPISGWDTISTRITGMNVWDNNADSAIVEEYPSGNGCLACPIKLKPNADYMLYIPTNNRGTEYISLTTENVQANSPKDTIYINLSNTETYVQGYKKFRTSTNGYAFINVASKTADQFWSRLRETVPQLMIYEGTEEIPYEQYTGKTITSRLGQTIYGGQLNWTTGTLTVDRVCLSLTGGENFVNATASDGVTKFYTLKNLNPAAIGVFDQGGTRSIYNMVVDKSPYDNTDENIAQIVSLGNINELRIRLSSDLDDVEKFKAELAKLNEAGTPFQVSYKIAEPFTVQLTPTEILALCGTNTLYTNTGDTTVVGRADPDATIKDLLARIDALEKAAIGGV